MYGPIIAVYRGLGDRPGRGRGADRDLTALATRFDRGTTGTVMDWDYLVLTARARLGQARRW